MAFGGPRSSCVRPGVHSALRQDFRKDLTPCRMALPFVSASAHAPHSDETPGPTATRRSSHSARRLRSLAFLCSSVDKYSEDTLVEQPTISLFAGTEWETVNGFHEFDQAGVYVAGYKPLSPGGLAFIHLTPSDDHGP